MECQTTGSMTHEQLETNEARLQREHLAVLCKALAHPTRIQIVQFLATVDTCFCGDIVQQLPLAQSTVSQHLKILKEAGLVQGEIDGPRTCYYLDRQHLVVLKSLLTHLP